MTKTIATYYHWASPESSSLIGDKIETNRCLYVCDDRYSWASPHVPGMQLFEVDCVLSKVFKLEGQFGEYETIFNDQFAVNKLFLERGGFDAVIYTPHELSRGVRQIALFKPKQQIIALRRVPDREIDWDAIKANRSTMSQGWRSIMQDY